MGVYRNQVLPRIQNKVIHPMPEWRGGSAGSNQ